VEGGVEGAQIKLVDEVIHGRFEGAGYELFLKTNSKEPSLGTVNVFIPGHNSSRVP
jgi:hypothetical protein